MPLLFLPARARLSKMTIQVEYNPDLALRKYATEDRAEAECLPELLTPGKKHPFLKKGQRNYWILGEIPLLETEGDSRLSRPLASIIILEARHHVRNGVVWTDGLYRIVEVYNTNSPRIYFEGFQKVRNAHAPKPC